MKKIIAILLGIICLTTLAACDISSMTKDYKKTVTITFVQDGEEDIVKTITEGEDLTSIPNIVYKTGYSASWDRTDFTNIKSDITVNAVYTPNEYTITYVLDKQGATISSDAQTVKYDSNFSLLIPSCDGYQFNGWKIQGTNTTFSNGKWTRLEDITLVASWEMMEWTPNY